MKQTNKRNNKYTNKIGRDAQRAIHSSNEGSYKYSLERKPVSSQQAKRYRESEGRSSHTKHHTADKSAKRDRSSAQHLVSTFERRAHLREQVSHQAVRPPRVPTSTNTAHRRPGLGENDVFLRQRLVRSLSIQLHKSVLTSLPMHRGTPFVVILGFGALPTADSSEQKAVRVACALFGCFPPTTPISVLLVFFV